MDMTKIEDYTFEEKQQALDEAWEIMQVNEGLSVHSFTCNNEHRFFMPLHLPRPLDEFLEIAEGTLCPICQSKKIDISFKEMRVVNVL